MTALRGAILVAATISIGLMAGVFFTYAVAVMPGLGRTDDRTFVGAFQSIDRSIESSPTRLALFGGLAGTVLAAALHLGDDQRSVLPWIVAAGALYAAVILVTGGINVPRNTAIKAAGHPDSIDLADVRSQFDEVLWVRWNYVRLVLNAVSLGCMSWASVLFGRST